MTTTMKKIRSKNVYEYDLAEQDPKVDDDAYWSGSTLLIQDDCICFVMKRI